MDVGRLNNRIYTIGKTASVYDMMMSTCQCDIFEDTFVTKNNIRIETSWICT